MSRDIEIKLPREVCCHWDQQMEDTFAAWAAACPVGVVVRDLDGLQLLQSPGGTNYSMRLRVLEEDDGP